MRKAAYLLILTLTLMIIATLTPITIADDPGRIIRVPEDVKSVRKAVAMAGPGDTVVISEGIYREFLYIDNKENLTIIGRGNVTLDINLRNRFVIYVRNSRNIVIKGLGTLRARESNIIIENSHNITLENITSSSTYQAIFITRSNHVVLKNVIANHSLEGIIIESSKNCVIINAYIYDIGFTSIDISKSSNIVIDGVRINKSLSITIGGSSNITIKNSLIKAFRKPKIVPDIHFISGIENVTIEDTVLLGGGLRFELPTSIPNVDLRNVTFKNLPIALLRNRDFGWRSLREIYGDVGQVITYNVSRLIISGLSFKKTFMPIHIAKSSDIFISSNEFRDIIIGICVDHESENITIEHNVFKACLSPIDVAKSHNIIIYNNTVDRAESSITLIDTSNVIIYANLLKNMAWYAVTGIRNKDVIVFGNSVINVRDETFLVSTKITFTSPYKLTYAYKGKEFTSYVGNYWGSKANVTDSNGDGISDKPHSFLLIPSNVATKVTDKYPLVRPHTEYVLPPLFELPRVKLLTKDIEVYAGSNKTISMLITNVNALEKKYVIRIKTPQGINAYGKALISVKPQESLTYNITITVPRGIKEGSYLLKAIIRDLTPIPNTTITKTIPIKVIVDKEPPRIKANVSVSNNTLTLQWLVSDNWGVKRVTVIIDNETLSVGSKGIKRFTLRPGKHELVIRAEDLGGNNATFSKLVEIVKPTPKPTRTVITTITTSITSSVTSPTEVRKPKPEVDMTKFLVLAIIVVVIAAIIIKALRR